MTEQNQDSFFADFGLDERLLKAVTRQAYAAPTPVQTAMIPPVLAGKDIQASAETGSGKTAAYLLPALQRMLANPAPETATRCLVLVPTRELAQQVGKDCEALAAFTGVRSMTLVGGKPLKEQKARVRKNPEILIATPGRLLEHIQHRSVELGDLEMLVLDEADRMLDMGFREDVLAIIESCGSERQSILLSATLHHRGIGAIAGHILKAPVVVDLGTHRRQHASIEQSIILADDFPHKDRLVLWLLGNEEYQRALVFTNTRVHADQLASKLKYHDLRAASLHGELTQEERQQVMQRFRDGGIKVLVATDLAARGLDVKGIDLVLNYAMARSGDEYVHRIGRTGRAGEQGQAVSLISPQEWNLTSSIERYLNLAFTRRSVKGLEARFKGPVKKTKSRKADERAKADGKAKKKGPPKAKQRHRYKKDIGKPRRSSTTNAGGDSLDGFAPIRKKS